MKENLAQEYALVVRPADRGEQEARVRLASMFTSTYSFAGCLYLADKLSVGSKQMAACGIHVIISQPASDESQVCFGIAKASQIFTFLKGLNNHIGQSG